MQHSVKTQGNMTSLVEEILHGLILYMLKIINLNMENHMVLEKERTAVFSLAHIKTGN